VRLDSGVAAGSSVPLYYDSLLAKIIVWGTDRAAAIARLDVTLAETRVAGIATNLPLLRAIAGDDVYRAGATTTRYLDERMPLFHLGERAASEAEKRSIAGALLARAGTWRIAATDVPLAFAVGPERVRATATWDGAGWVLGGDLSGTIEAGDRDASFDSEGGTIAGDGRPLRWTWLAPPRADAEAVHAAGSGEVVAPMPGKIVSVAVEPGGTVEEHALLVVLEAMKMEHRSEAPIAGTVRDGRVKAGELVASGAALVSIGPARETP